MPELIFEKVLTTSNASASKVCIGNEPDNTITKFFIEAQRQGNEVDTVVLSDYDNLDFVRVDSLMSSQAVSNIGIKSFPQIGTIGFYTLKYENRSLILAPIYTISKKRNAPTLTITNNSGTLLITLSNPKDVVYDCYRIVVRNGYFTEEYISYEQQISLPAPVAPGSYTVSAFGYLNEQLASVESELHELVVS